MINITDIVVPSNKQWMAAIRGMRNPMNSWDKMDSKENTCDDIYCDSCCGICSQIKLGENDYDLMKRLVLAGTEHSKFLRMLPVVMDINAPLYWWKEMDTYKIGTVANSCSTMHKLTSKKFELDDFSHEHLGVRISAEKNNGESCYQNLWIERFREVIESLNTARSYYLNAKDSEIKKAYWWQMIQLLPSSYNQKRTVFLNYAVLANIYHQRCCHKLDEWNNFCDMVEKLPYSEFITKRFE